MEIKPKLNSYVVGIIEGILFLLLLSAGLGLLERGPSEDGTPHFFDIFLAFVGWMSLLLLPFVNLRFRNFKTVIGNLLGIFLPILVFHH